MIGAAGGGGLATVGARIRLLATAALAVVALSACTDDNPSASDGGRGGTSSKGAALEVELASGTEGLDTRERSDVQDAIGDVLSEYVVGGFLGDYPREDFVRSFDHFTARAARGAVRDIDLLTAARFSGSDGVRPTKLLAKISCLTVAGEVVAATAHVDFAFEVTEGKAAPQPATLRGRFLLDQKDGEWSIFGYDVLRDDAERVGS